MFSVLVVLLNVFVFSVNVMFGLLVEVVVFFRLDGMVRSSVSIDDVRVNFVIVIKML